MTGEERGFNLVGATETRCRPVFLSYRNYSCLVFTILVSAGTGLSVNQALNLDPFTPSFLTHLLHLDNAYTFFILLSHHTYYLQAVRPTLTHNRFYNCGNGHTRNNITSSLRSLQKMCVVSSHASLFPNACVFQSSKGLTACALLVFSSAVFLTKEKAVFEYVHLYSFAQFSGQS